MSERDQSSSGAGRPGAPGDWRETTTPGLEPVAGPPTGYGSAGYGTAGYPPRQPGGYGPAGGGSTAPPYSTAPVPVRRPDGLAALLLVLAGIAAAISLLLRWLPRSEDIGPDSDLTGWELVRRGIDDLAQGGLGEVLSNGFWQPLAVILGGGVLFLLGLLMVLPARTHRFLGLLALLVALVAGAGVLVPFARAGWDTAVVGTGFWFAAAVPALGLLGALKALLTRRKYRRR